MRSKSFHAAYYGNMGDNGIPDQIAMIEELAGRHSWFDLILFPNRRHGFGNEPYMMRRRWDYFVRHLLGAEPPEYEIQTGRRSRRPVS